ncbi:VTT domain-containing protein [Anaerobaca lacustris]|uniref:Glycosyltransferase family 39 protein n=1 Tax=Anaerobaca lacustris TaxID=3044600 RepID=A0AAW6U6J2_9BACT|nr:glycosyltransferase family 39 protein [Sedimentisphaerales bacterium M17dextr]
MSAPTGPAAAPPLATALDETKLNLPGETTEGDTSDQPLKQRARIAVLIGLAAAATALLRLTPLGEVLMDFHRLRALLDEGNVWAELVFVPIVAILVAVGTPRLIFYGLAGLMFGFWKGLLLVHVGTLAGAYAAFLCARWAGRDWFSNWLDRHPSAGKVLTVPPSVWSVVMARQLPIGGLVINLGLGLSSVTSVQFVIGSLFGFLPAGLVVLLIAGGLVDDQTWESVSQLLAAALVVLLSGLWLGRRRIRRVFRKAAPHALLWGAVISAAVVALYLVRLSGPSDLEGYAQNRNVGYIMDAAWAGNWVVQHDVQNRITSKPPLHTWITAALAKIGGINRLTLTLPSFVSVLALSLLVFAVGSRSFGWMAGGFAGLATAMAPIVAKHVAIVRTDPLFALAVALVALAAWRAWNRGGGWTPFWLAAAAATLIKGPLGLLLGAAGLLAFFWERRTDPTTPRPRGSHAVGIAIYLALCLGWFLLALHVSGYALIDKMIVQELFGQATGAHKHSFPGQNLAKPTIYLLGRFLPFSLFTFIGLWRVVFHPAAQAIERRFERFLACWLVAGMAMFSLAAHHRADLLLPLWPAGALLAGRQIARLREPLGDRLLTGCAAATCLILMGFAYWTYHTMDVRRAGTTNYSVEVRQAAKALREAGIDPTALTHVHTPVTLQLYLHTYKRWVDANEVRGLLDRGQPLQIVTGSLEEQEHLYDVLRGAHVEELYHWPQDGAPEGGFYLAVMEAVPEA